MLTGDINVDDDTVFPVGLNAANATFDLFNFARMTLLNDDVIYDSTITGVGLAVLGGQNIFSGLTLGGTVTAVNHGPAVEGGDLKLGADDDVTTLRNNDDGVWTLLGDGDNITGSAGSRFVNVGVFAKTDGDDVSNVSANFISPGEVVVNSGTLDFSAPHTLIESGINGIGMVEFSGGRAVLSPIYPGSGVLNYSVSYSVSVDVAAGGTLVVQGGYDSNIGRAVRVTHYFSGDDFVVQAGGTLVLGPDIGTFANASSLTLEGGAAQNNEIDGTIRGGSINEGDFESTGTLHFGDGARVVTTVSTTPAATIDGRVVFDAREIEINSLTIDGGTLVNEGDLYTSQVSGAGRLVNSGSMTTSFSLEGAITLVNSGSLAGIISDGGGATDYTIRNLAGGSWVLGAGNPSAPLQGVIANDGLLSIQGGQLPNAGASFDSVLHNNGVLDAASGYATVGNAVDGVGQDRIESFTGLDFAGAVGSGQTTVFEGGDSTLTIGDLSDFAATISQFDQNGSVNYIDVDADKWSFGGYTANDSGTGGSLLFNGAAGATMASLTLSGSSQAGAYQASGFSATVADDKLQIGYTPPITLHSTP